VKREAQRNNVQAPGASAEAEAKADVGTAPVQSLANVRTMRKIMIACQRKKYRTT
jgi:hypothetical protein